MKIAQPMPPPSGFQLPRPPVLPESLPQPAIPIIVKSKGVAYGVQNGYANWHQGLRKP